MKRSAVNFLLCILFSAQMLHAQKMQRGSVLTAGAGYSLLGLFSGFEEGDDRHLNSSPVFLLNYDYAVIDGLSLGLSGSHQQFRYEYTYGGYPLAPVYTDQYLRTSVGLRCLAHFGHTENVDVYAGGRMGYTFWDEITDNVNPGYLPGEYAPSLLRTSIRGIHYTTQGVFGLRYFFSDAIGIGTEIGIGAPACFAVNLNARF